MQFSSTDKHALQACSYRTLIIDNVLDRLTVNEAWIQDSVLQDQDPGGADQDQDQDSDAQKSNQDQDQDQDQDQG